MVRTHSALALLLVTFQSVSAAGQQLLDGPMQRLESDERCSPHEHGCEHGFIRVKWPQPIQEKCARPVDFPVGVDGRAATTIFEMVVDSTGNVAGARVNLSSGNSVLDAALLAAASNCKFVPGFRGGVLAELRTMWIYDWNRNAKIPAVMLVAPPPALVPAPPRIEHCPKPEYPAAALRAGAQGTTVIKLTVDSSGSVTQSEVVESSGKSREHRMLDKTASSALAQCKFSAVQGAGERIARLSYTFSFTVESAASAPKP
jgi:TonB family protein